MRAVAGRTRVLVVDRDAEMRARLACVAAALPGGVRVCDVSSLEWAVDALQRNDFDLIVMAADLGVGTSALVSAVTLMGAGSTAALVIHTQTPTHGEALALESIGITCYKASADVGPDVLLGLLPQAHRAAA